MKLTTIAIGVLAATMTLAAGAQVSTTCTRNGDTTNCTSYDYGAQYQQMYQAGQQAGNFIGALIELSIIKHQVHKVRDQQCHAGGIGYHWSVTNTTGYEWGGVCTAKQAGVKFVKPKQEPKAKVKAQLDDLTPTQEKGVLDAANGFIAHHPEYIACPDNFNAMQSYMVNTLQDGDLPTEQDFENAYNALSPTGGLKLRWMPVSPVASK